MVYLVLMTGIDDVDVKVFGKFVVGAVAVVVDVPWAIDGVDVDVAGT